MKKLLAGLFIFGFLFMGIQQVHASVLSDALLQIQNLKNELILLRASLKASVAGSTDPTNTISTTATSITSTNAIIGANISIQGLVGRKISYGSEEFTSTTPEISGYAYCYKENILNANYMCSGENNNISNPGSFSMDMYNSLKPSTNYIYFVYIKSTSKTTCFSNTDCWTLNSPEGTFTTLAATSQNNPNNPSANYRSTWVLLWKTIQGVIIQPGVTASTANVGGEIPEQYTSSENGYLDPRPITEKGACYGNSLTTMTNCIPASNSTGQTTPGNYGPYTTYITGLSSNTTYYYRMYAKNGYETIYSTSSTFKTLNSTSVTPVNGVFSDWADYGSCTNGLKPQIRSCTNPAPSNGGLPCVGDIGRSVSCTVTTTCTAVLSASPTSIISGGSTTLSWSTSNCSSVYIGGNINSSVALSGTKVITPSQTTDYDLTAQSTSSDFQKKTVRVTVTPASTTCTAVLSASPTSIISGGSTTLSWSTSNCSSVYIGGNINSSVALSGTKVITPSQTTDYDLTAQSTSSDFQKKTVRVTVTPAGAPSITFTSPNGETYKTGEEMIVNWQAKNVPDNSIAMIALVDKAGYYTYLTQEPNPSLRNSTSIFNINIHYGSIKLKIPDAISGGSYRVYLSCINQSSNEVCTSTGSMSYSNYFTINSSTTYVCAPGDIHNTITGELCPNSTTPSFPIVSILPVTSLTSTSATIGATVTSMGLPAATASSMCVSTSATITGANCSTIGISTNLSRNITGLIPNTKYYYAGNAINTTGTGWSSTGTFTTPASSEDNGCLPGYKYSTTISNYLCPDGGLKSATIFNQNNNITLGSRTLKQGTSGEDVRSLQIYLGIGTDGIFGRGTAAAVKAWQAANGLTPDGLFGKNSYKKMSGEQ